MSSKYVSAIRAGIKRSRDFYSQRLPHKVNGRMPPDYKYSVLLSERLRRASRAGAYLELGRRGQLDIIGTYVDSHQ